MLLGPVVLAWARSDAATDNPTPEARDAEAGEWFFLLGPAAAGVFDPGTQVMAFLEYRYTTGRYRPGPWLAVEATESDRFVGFGAFVDLPLGRRWVFTPSLGAAIYREDDGLGLGYPLQFRSTAELTCRLGRARLGASFAHFSNAGLGETNPGAEILKIVWIAPFDRPRTQ